jgi:hypothetical protein
MSPIGLLLFGGALYFLFWFSHETGVPNPGAVGEWRGVPAQLRPFLRRGQGPILIGAVLLQFVGVVQVVVSIFWLLGLLAPPFGVIAAYASFGSILAAGIGWGWLILAERQRPE